MKSASTMRSSAASEPLAKSEAAGPTPRARVAMKPTTSNTKAPIAIAPPRIMRRHDRCGCAFSAIVATVPDGTFGTIVPPSVIVGVAVAALRATCLT